MGQLMRVRNWDVRLQEWADEVTGAPFQWGETDCGSLVRGALEAMYPPDDVPLPEPPPDYGTVNEALRAYSTRDIGQWLREGGAYEVPLSFVQRGDVILGTDEAGGMQGAAVVIGIHYMVASETEGVVLRRMRDLRERGAGTVLVLRPGGSDG